MPLGRRRHCTTQWTYSIAVLVSQGAYDSRGACATAVAAALTGKAGRKSQIVMDGGMLNIEWRESDNHVYMTGPAEFVFDGEIYAP